MNDFNITANTGRSYEITNCQLCNSEKLNRVFFFGFHPTVNDFKSFNEPKNSIESFPLELFLCQDCSLVQLSLIVDPKKLFPPEYAYTSGTTTILINNFLNLANECKEILNLPNSPKIIDIGSNDWTLLKAFKNCGFKVLGVEPTDVYKKAISSGIDTINSLFDDNAVSQIKNKKFNADIITATNVFAHIEDLHGVVSRIKDLMHEDTVFVSESHYFEKFIETSQFDTVYHEHLRYYTLKNLITLFDMHGLEVFHATEIPTHGGSIRVYTSKKDKYKKTKNFEQILNSENNQKKMDERLLDLSKDIKKAKQSIMKTLSDLKLQNKSIVGIGAPSRASTLINFLGLNNEYIDYIGEISNSLKIGKFIPGTNIPVVDEERIFNENPDYVINFSWHINEDIKKILKKKGYKGNLIVPLPLPIIECI